MSVTKLNGLRLQRMIVAGANELHANKQAVDAMNVFPVPDGDTGTNMSLTMLAAARETEKGDALRVDEVTKRASGGALRGARGNSGVITSQILRGFAKGLEGLEEAGVKELTAAMEQGVKTAYKAVMKPKEGTILTVARACAEAAVAESEKTDDIEVFLKAVLEHAHDVLNQTPDMLPVLKEAGVVDAGGRGLLYILEGALKHINSEEALQVAEPTQQTAKEYAALASVDNESITFGYCTEFFINVKNPDDATVQQLKSYLGTIGDSVVCVSDDEIIKIHVHTDHPGLALEKALTIGSLSGLKIDNMREQHNNIIDFTASEKKTPVEQARAAQPVQEERPKKDIGFVSISAGSGLTAIFHNLGVDEVIEGGQTMNPSTDDILREIDATPAEIVFVLPNNKNIIMAAEQCIRLVEGKQVVVLPTKTVPQGISALMVMDPEADTEANVQAMQEALSRVHTSEITYAARDSDFDGFAIKRGDYLALTEHQLFGTDRKVEKLLRRLAEADDQQNAEFINIFYGEDVTEREAQKALKLFTECCPNAEITLLSGGQPVYYYMISAE